MLFESISHNIQDIKRLKNIISVFFEVGFDYVIDETKLKIMVPFSKRIKSKISFRKKNSLPIKLRVAFEKLGPTFIKLGQILSLRPDLVPAAYIAEFDKMQDRVPAFSFKTAKTIIESEFGKSSNELFRSIDEKPVAFCINCASSQGLPEKWKKGCSKRFKGLTFGKQLTLTLK